MKKLLLAFGIAAAGWTLPAAYLNWQISPSSTDPDVTGYDFAGARVVATADGGAATQLAAADPETGVTQAGQVNVAAGSTAVINLSQLGDPTAYSFYIELVNWDDAINGYAVVGMSTPQTYAQLASGGYVDTGLSLSPAAANVWHGTAYMTPEPTGGALLLLGLAVAALRRKHDRG